tara:strand:+ start:261 stop:734 length:474 start_codon:yes stop_codon:yes gene_type:complete
MKFLCIECDSVMDFAERRLPGDGTLAAVFSCDSCGRDVAMLTNPMETQLVSSLGVKIGGREVPAQPLETVRTSLEGGREDAFDISNDSSSQSAEQASQSGQSVTWTPAAIDRLNKVPTFVQGMVKRIYIDWAKEQGVDEMTPEVMDRARTELGLEGM